jgi:hypothetical protein
MSYINRPLIIIVVQADSTRIGGPSAIIKKPSKGELEEAVEGLAVVEQLVRFIRVRGFRVPQLVGINGIKITCVRWVLDTRYVRRHLPAQPFLEIDAGKKRMGLDLVGILAQSPVCPNAQFQNQILALGRQVRLLRDVQSRFPIDHLQICF